MKAFKKNIGKTAYVKASKAELSKCGAVIAYRKVVKLIKVYDGERGKNSMYWCELARNDRWYVYAEHLRILD